MDPDRDDDASKAGSQHPPAGASGASANPPQVRSRITVVCAECKRLKLKCDRRTPCGSCQKRDTVVRCVYSPAAAEKVDLHSLNNRLIQVEALLSQQLNNCGQVPQSQPATASTSRPSPPAPLTPLELPLLELHAACLAPLGLPAPALAARVKPEPPQNRSSAPLAPVPPLIATQALLRLLPGAQRLPARLAAAHAALSAAAAAPFPFAWFEARAYAFLSGMAATSSTSASAVPAPNSAKPAANEAKEARKRERERNRERARTIFAGGAANSPNNYANFPGFPALLNSSKSSAAYTTDSPIFAGPQEGLAHVNNAAAVYGSGGMAYDGYGDVPPVHALSESPDSDPIELDGDEDLEPEVDELDENDDNADGVVLRQPGAHRLDGRNFSPDGGSGQAARNRVRGDPRIAFFALLCGVLALSAPAAGSSSSPHQEDGSSDEAPAEDLAALAKRAAEEYFAPQPNHARHDDAGPVKEREGADLDAVLAMWVVGVGLLRRSGAPGEEVYVHLAQTVAHARVVGLDWDDAQSAHRPLAATARPRATAVAKASLKCKQAGGIKTEDGEVEGCRNLNGQAKEKDEGEWRSALRARTWWAVCWGDLLVSDALGLAPAITLGTAKQNQQFASHQQYPYIPQMDGEDKGDLLAHGADWAEDGDGEPSSAGGRRFGTWVRLARVLHSVHGLPGLDGACTAENAIRAWAAAESGDVDTGASPSLPAYVPSGLGTSPRLPAYAPRTEFMDVDSPLAHPSQGREEVAQHRAEVALLANRVILRVWVAWLAFNQTGAGIGAGPPPPTPPQAMYGAVGAAHGVVQACRTLATSHTHSSSLALLAAPPARALFDAGVVCAHAALRHTTAVFAAGAREALGSALALLRDGQLAAWAGRAEAVRVLDGLARRAGLLGDVFGAGGATNIIRINGHPDSQTSTLKRKHDVALGAGQVQAPSDALADPLTPQQTGKLTLALAIKEKEREWEREREKEKEMGLVKDKKKRTGYPAVGIRVRSGKESSYPPVGVRVRLEESPISPHSAARKSSAGANSASSPLATSMRPQTAAEEMGYYPQHPLQTQSSQQQTTQTSQQQQQMMDAYRSRSSSISQSHDPRMQPLSEIQPRAVAIEFSQPFSASAPVPAPATSSPLNAQQGMEFSRRSFGELPPQQQPQGYAGDAASVAIYDLQPPRAGSYDADAYGGSAGSPYGNSSGTLSTASSPYTTTSGGLSTPTFTNNGGSSVHNPSPPTYMASQVPPPTQFYAAGYAQQQQQQYEMDGNAGVGINAADVSTAPSMYEKGSGHQPQMYHMKPHMEHHHTTQYHPEQEPRHDMAWQPSETQHAPQFWTADEYKFYPQ